MGETKRKQGPSTTLISVGGVKSIRGKVRGEKGDEKVILCWLGSKKLRAGKKNGFRMVTNA